MDNQIKQGIFNHLSQSLAGQVSLDVWLQNKEKIARIDQDECLHCKDVKEVSKEISNLHPGISLTYYDLEKHADRAIDADIQVHPTTILRGNARTIKFIGFWWGALFPAFLDLLVTIGNGIPVMDEKSKKIISAIDKNINIDLFVSPFENLSTNQMIILANFAVLSKKIQLTIYEMSEFPILANKKNISKLPAMDINNNRIDGSLEEKELAEQLEKIASGNTEIIVKLDSPSMPYISEQDAKKMQSPAQQVAEPGKLIIPGRD
ncbi:MAG: hypothetical protein QMB22_02190 [Dehalococcoidia bacterium]|jgi:alkyl hydroperoxide reductase subunit AhpF|nr:MAG: hypothetical protein DK305_000657 [Chloroflexota bacterium]|tara:strand:+ start:9750 stop:10538 length:789 start_codon:yes stop_codon:yes gene_type:complete